MQLIASMPRGRRRLAATAAAVATCAVTVAGCAVAVAGCSQRLATAPSAVAAPSSVATAIPGPTAPAPVTTGPTTATASTPPTRSGSGPDAVPPSATVVVASLIEQTLGVVTDRNMYGPVTVTSPAKVSQVIDLINSAPRRVPGIGRCPMQGAGNMTLVFDSSANGPVAATVVISTSGCLGMIVRPVAGGVIGLDGGPDTVTQIESILGLPWPKPAG